VGGCLLLVGEEDGGCEGIFSELLIGAEVGRVSKVLWRLLFCWRLSERRDAAIGLQLQAERMARFPILSLN
jgi:hypothetical protein